MRVSVIQMNSVADKAANLRQAEALIEAAIRADRPDLVVLPECFTYLGGTVAGARDAGEAVPSGEACRMLAALARRHRIFVHGGSLVERAGPLLHNSSVVFARDGEELARYRKIHMFDVVTPDGTAYRESATYAPGNAVVTVDLEGVRFGCTICYDIRFAELYARLAAAGASVILIPSAFYLMTGKDHWEVLCRARAIETQCFVVAPNQHGPHVENGEPRSCCGNSMIVDPWGSVIARVPNRTGFATATLDLDDVARVRQAIPVAAQRRPDVVA